MRTLPFRFAFLLALPLAARAQSPTGVAPVPRQVAAPAADILAGVVRLPDPAELAQSSRAWFAPVDVAWVPGAGWSFESDVAVDADGPLALAVLAPDATAWSWSLAAPGGATEPLAALLARSAAERAVHDLAGELPGWTIDRVDLHSARAGTWRVTLRADGRPSTSRPDGAFLLARGAGTVAASAHVTTLQTLSDAGFGIAARFTGPDAAGVVDPRGAVLVENAGRVRRFELADDGLHDDAGAGDGVLGALLPPGLAGRVRARVELRGETGAGQPIARSVQLAFPAIERRALLDGRVDAGAIEEDRLHLELGAFPLAAPSKLHVSAEVWGTDARGALVPVCWLSRMQAPVEPGERWTLALDLDLGWLDVAGARRPLVLRAVRIQDPDTHVPFDLAEELPVALSVLPRAARPGQAVTSDMLMGSVHATRTAPHAPAAPQPYAPALMLVHGYCSGGSVWPAADFTQPKLEFLDPDQNRTHDEFALLMAQAGSAHSSFGVVAHSQGGPAALHLLTYYQSGLDFATGPRRIQTVGSPYQGTPLASLGFLACGNNNDMTTSGAPTWLAGIPSWARAEVWYWTTSNSGSTCSGLTGWLLDNPEDGTVEMWRGQLPGGNSMGHVVGWCHTTGMSNPAQYTDHVRNAERNSQAAR